MDCSDENVLSVIQSGSTAIVELNKVISDSGGIICPYMKFKGRGIEDANNIAKRMLPELINWKCKYEYEIRHKAEVMDFLESRNYCEFWGDNSWIHKNDFKDPRLNDYWGISREGLFISLLKKEYEKEIGLD